MGDLLRVRMLLHWLWWAALLMFAAMGVALCVMTPTSRAAFDASQGKVLGVLGLALVGLCAWQWSRPVSRSWLAEVARCGLLALPATPMPWISWRGTLAELHDASGPALVPGAVAAWFTIWAVLAGLIVALRASDERREAPPGPAPTP